MQLRQQIITVEQARKLKELGIAQDSIWSWYCDEGRDDDPVVNLSEPLKVVGGVGHYDKKYSAFNLSEVDIMLHTASNLIYNAVNRFDSRWDDFRYSHGLRIRLAADLLIYSVEHGFLKIKDCNERLQSGHVYLEPKTNPARI